ncbi:MAG: carotenoid biosynthesis protein [Cyclobacteriaceae bacterium]
MSTLDIVKKNSNLKSLFIFIIWIFQLSAIIGISLGHYDWFISKTPLNLIITAVLLTIHFPIDNFKKVVVALVIFTSSLLIEWIGVHFGFLFGVYEYGRNLGLKIDGVPLLIGINWAVLILSTAAIADKLVGNSFLKITVGALLMVFMDFFIETSAPPFDFWIWASGAAPLRNYISWFIVSVLLHTFYHRTKMKGDFTFSCHLYAAQLLFFIYFYGFHRI